MVQIKNWFISVELEYTDKFWHSDHNAIAELDQNNTMHWSTHMHVTSLHHGGQMLSNQLIPFPDKVRKENLHAPFQQSFSMQEYKSKNNLCIPAMSNRLFSSHRNQAEREELPEPGSRMPVMSRLPCGSCRWNAKWQERVSQTPIGTRPPLPISMARLHGAQTCSVGLHEADLCGHLASTTPHNAHVYVLPSLSLSVYGWLRLTRSLPSSSSWPMPEWNRDNRLTESHLSPMRRVTYS